MLEKQKIICLFTYSLYEAFHKRLGNENRYFTIHNGTVVGGAS